MTLKDKQLLSVYRLTFVLSLLVLTCGVHAGEPNEMAIQHVQIALTEQGEATEAEIKGINFPEPGKAHVALVGINDDLTIIGDATTTMINVALPPNLPAGEYLLTVFKEDKGPVCKNGTSKYCDEFDLSIGVRGLQGIKGQTGDKGPTGDVGLVGDKGSVGDKGQNGDKGVKGDKGPTGDKGAKGDQGGTGDKGATGDKGPIGDPGMPPESDPQFVQKVVDAENYLCANAALPKPEFCGPRLGGPGTINFFIVSDPQFGWGSGGNKDYIDANYYRAIDTMIQVARLTSTCEDCSKILPVAGDLTNADTESNGYTRSDFGSWYGRAHEQVEQNFVKVLDGIGNHDTHRSIFDTNGTSFHTEYYLKNGLDKDGKAWHQDLAGKGWKIVDFKQSEIDKEPEHGGCLNAANQTQKTHTHFGWEGAGYCYQKVAMYYTVALSNPAYPSTEPVAYLVQLHNEIGSPTAVAYLEHVRDNVMPNSDKPVILVGHKLDDFTGPKRDANDNVYQHTDHGIGAVIAQLPVAAILYGHYHCDQNSDKDHCDYLDNNPRLLIDRFGVALINKWGKYIPRVNVSAAFHNIFWGISLDTVRGEVSFKRFNRGTAAGLSDRTGNFRTRSKAIGGHNLPITNEEFFTCNYEYISPSSSNQCKHQIQNQISTSGSLATAAITHSGSQQIYAFYENGRYSRSTFAGVLDNGYPAALPGGWRGVPREWIDRIDAALEYGRSNIAYMFSDGQYIKLEGGSLLDGYPLDMPGGWSNMPVGWESIDAALYYPPNDKIYFFKGNEYVRLTGTTVDDGYPLPLRTGWPEIPAHWERVDAATYRGLGCGFPGELYFINGEEYIRYNITGFVCNPIIETHDGYPTPRKLSELIPSDPYQ